MKLRDFPCACPFLRLVLTNAAGHGLWGLESGAGSGSVDWFGIVPWIGKSGLPEGGIRIRIGGWIGRTPPEPEVAS